MKLCKDCFYYEEPHIKCVDEQDIEKYSRCNAITITSVITGRKRVEVNFCEIMRREHNACGVDAKLYQEPEPREMWQRDEPQGVTNWDTGWNGVYAEENQNG